MNGIWKNKSAEDGFLFKAIYADNKSNLDTTESVSSIESVSLLHYTGDINL